jgi:hypothetical protein
LRRPCVCACAAFPKAKPAATGTIHIPPFRSRQSGYLISPLRLARDQGGGAISHDP